MSRPEDAAARVLAGGGPPRDRRARRHAGAGALSTPPTPAPPTSARGPSSSGRRRSAHRRPSLRRHAARRPVRQVGALGDCTGKCAYCEAPLTEQAMLVDRFRPARARSRSTAPSAPTTTGGSPTRGRTSTRAAPSARASRARASRSGKPRAAPGTTGVCAPSGAPLLLEPRLRRPGAAPRLRRGRLRRLDDRGGRATIEILGLNRAQLLASRVEALAQARSDWEAVGADGDQGRASTPWPSTASSTAASLLGHASPVPQHLGPGPATGDRPGAPVVARRTVLGRRGRRATCGSSRQRSATGSRARSTGTSRARRLLARGRERQRGLLQAHAPDRADRGAQLQGHRRPRPQPRDLRLVHRHRAPWLMLLGENGCGKSSLLQAVAPRADGQRRAGRARRSTRRRSSGTARERLRPRPPRREPRADRAPILTSEQRAVRGRRPTPRCSSSATARRGSSRAAASRRPRDVVARPGAEPVRPVLADRRLDRLAARARRPHASTASRARSRACSGSSARTASSATAARGSVDVEAFGLRVPLEHLSDGYQSVVALATDVMISLLQQWPTRGRRRGHRADRRARRAPAPALADADRAEPPAGLPARPVPRLDARPALPARARRRRGRRRQARPRGPRSSPSPTCRRSPGLRVDQLLTSEHFGLNSTIDPELDALFAEYYLLKAKPHRTAARHRPPRGARGSARRARGARLDAARADRARGRRRLPRQGGRDRRPRGAARAEGRRRRSGSRRSGRRRARAKAVR